MTTPATSTRTTMCSKNEGGCGLRFEVPGAAGPAPKLCLKCKGREPEQTTQRLRAYDCDSCGAEFRASFDREQSTYHCPECLKNGYPCAGGCGTRSKKFGRGNMHCVECKPVKQSAEAQERADRERMLAEARARGAARGAALGSVANGNEKPVSGAWKGKARPAMVPFYVNRTAEQNQEHQRLRQLNDAAAAERAIEAAAVDIEPAPAPSIADSVIQLADIAEARDGRVLEDDGDVPLAPPRTSTCMACGLDFEVLGLRGRKPRTCPRCLRIEPTVKRAASVVAIEVVQEVSEATEEPMAREATCQKSAGGCGIVFKAQSSTGKLPTRCPECKAARGARPSGSSAPRKEKAPRKKREREHENSVTFAPKASTTAATTSSTLFTVRINALAIDCHSVEALDVLVQRYGGTLAP